MPDENATPALASETFIYSGTELEAMAQARNYCRWILRYFEPYLRRKIVEIGAGAGTFSELILHRKETSELVLFEAAANLCPILRQRFTDSRIQIHCSFFEPSVLNERPDAVVMVNVLEHVLDDDGLLKQIHDSLKPGGNLLLFVPALEWNYGSLDRAFEHHRRYKKRELRRKIQGAGFSIRTIRYVNFMGIASWFLAGRVLHQSTIKASQVRWYDRWIVPWSFRIEEFCQPPIGQSLLAVAST